jgi:FkbM family methyltransferase
MWGEKVNYYDVLTFYRDLVGYLQEGFPEEGLYITHSEACPEDLAILTAHFVGPQGKVFAFEPNPNLRYYVQKMIEINPSPNNIQLFEYGLSSIVAQAQFCLNGDQSAIAGPNNYIDDRTKSKRTIETTIIDQFVTENNLIDKPIFIAQDIEGAELDAMEGAKETFYRGTHFLPYHHII